MRFDHSRQVQVIDHNQNGLLLRAVGGQHSCKQSCSSSGLCGGSAAVPATINLPLRAACDSSRVPIDQAARFNPPIGAELDVQVSSILLLVSSSLVYLGPVVLMLLFSVVSGTLHPQSEALAVLSAGVGFGLGLLLIHAIGSGKYRAGLAFKRFVNKHLAVEPGVAQVHR